MKKLKIQQIAPFGEHKLEVINPTTGFRFTVKGIDYEEEMLIGADPVNDNYPDTYPHCLHSVLPLLRNISCLTDTITHKGETFMPLLELAKLCQPKLEWKFDSEQDVVYADSNDGFKYGFFYSDASQSFHFNSVMGTPNQYALFQKLAEWHINFNGIPEGLYIDKNTLK